MAENKEEYKCSFCQKKREEVKYLWHKDLKYFICDECVLLAEEILIDEGIIDGKKIKF